MAGGVISTRCSGLTVWHLDVDWSESCAAAAEGGVFSGGAQGWSWQHSNSILQQKAVFSALPDPPTFHVNPLVLFQFVSPPQGV